MMPSEPTSPHWCPHWYPQAGSGWILLTCETREVQSFTATGIMSGTPVFAGTRVPFQTLIDYLEGGQPLSEFLEDFPTVSKEQAIATLEEAKEALLNRAHSA